MKNKNKNLKWFATIIAVIILLVFFVLQLFSSSPLGINESNLNKMNLVVGIIGAFASLIPTVIDGFGRLFVQVNGEAKTDAPLFTPVSQAQLRKNIAGEQDILPEWIDRGATSTSIMRRYKQIVITGKPGSGKLREAFELIGRLIQENHISGEKIFVPETGFWNTDTERLEKSLMQSLDHRLPTLFLIDGILSINPSEAYKRMDILLNFARQYPKVFVIVTAQTEEYKAHQKWFGDHSVQEIALPDLDAKQMRQLVSSGAKLFGLTVEKDAREALLAKGDGTPRLVLLALQSLSTDGKRRAKINAQDVLAALSNEWMVTRGTIQDRVPNSSFILDALDTFHLANLKPERTLILTYAKVLWDGTASWKNVMRKLPDFDGILANLANFGVNVSDETVNIHPLLIESPRNPEDALRKLKIFLQQEEQLKEVQEKYLDRIDRALMRVSAFGSWISDLFGSPLLIAGIGGFAILGALYSSQDLLTPQTLVYIFWGVVFAFYGIGFLRGWTREIMRGAGLIWSLFLFALLNDLDLAQYFLGGWGPVPTFLFHVFILIFLSLFFNRTVVVIQRLRPRIVQERLQDSLSGAIIGGLNGYLLMGSILYYLDQTKPIPSVASLPEMFLLYLPPEIMGTPGIYFAAVLVLVVVMVVYL